MTSIRALGSRWYIVEKTIIRGSRFYVLESERFGDSVPWIIVDSDYRYICDNTGSGIAIDVSNALEAAAEAEDDDTEDFLTPAERYDYIMRGVPDYGDY